MNIWNTRGKSHSLLLSTQNTKKKWVCCSKQIMLCALTFLFFFLFFLLPLYVEYIGKICGIQNTEYVCGFSIYASIFFYILFHQKHHIWNFEWEISRQKKNRTSLFFCVWTQKKKEFLYWSQFSFLCSRHKKEKKTCN